MFAFLLPGLPERQLSRNARRLIPSIFRSGAGPDKTLFNDEALAPYIEQASCGLTGGINYYRAAFRQPPARSRMIKAPTRLIWGMEDPVLGWELASPELYRGLVRQLDVLWIPGAGHWVQQEAPAQVNAALEAHWRSPIRANDLI